MKRAEIIEVLEIIKEDYEEMPAFAPRLPALKCAIEILKQPEILTYDEQCIFLSAMGRERKICEKLDKNPDLPSKHSLIFICKEIERKVKATLWRREE